MQLSATTKPESGGLTADGSTKRVLVAKEEYIRLRWAAAYWKAQHAGAVEREKQLKSENLSLRARVRELESQLWGRNGVPPVSWTPNPLGEWRTRCQEQDELIHPSFASR